MDLTTRCPQCGTCFSASLEQLKLRKGYIRCINCANIFDGYEAVVDGDSATTPAMGAPDPVVPEHNQPTTMASAARPHVPEPEHELARGHQNLAPVAQAHTPEPVIPSVLRKRHTQHEPILTATPVPTHERPASASPAHQPVFSISSSSGNRVSGARRDPVISTKAVASTRPEPAISGRPMPDASIYIEPRVQHDGSAAPVPEFLETQGRYRGVIRLFWSVLTVVGVLLLLAQLTYVYRSQIANQIPALRPVLTEACVSLHCKVAYARRIDQIAIMTSALKAAPGVVDPPNSMTLQLTLRNLYAQPQEWPTLVLDLTDFSGTVVARKNLAPANYLTSETLQHPFAASSEITVGVPIALNDLKINGYQLSKFFP